MVLKPSVMESPINQTDLGRVAVAVNAGVVPDGAETVMPVSATNDEGVQRFSFDEVAFTRSSSECSAQAL